MPSGGAGTRRHAAGSVGATPDRAVAAAAALHEDGYAVSLERHPVGSPAVGAAAAVVAEHRDVLAALGAGEAGPAPRSPDLTLLLPELVTPLATDVLPAGHGRSDAVVLERARQVCRAARNAGVGVTVDTDERIPVDRMLGLLRDLRKDFPETGVVVHAGQRRAEADCRALAHEESRVRLVRGPLPRRDPAAARRGGGGRSGRGLAPYRSRLEADRSFVRCLATLMAGQGTPVVAVADEALLRITSALAGRHARMAGSYELLLPHDVGVALRHRLHEQGEAVRLLVGWGAPDRRRLVGRALDRVAESPDLSGLSGLAGLVRALAPRERAGPHPGVPNRPRRTRS